ncbi:sensor histidine kinase [Aureivirga sp. CE67]|uniref:sensor histidine kinase n=1 Tax=Aureivirga sp. CE67 TaxID=1788983 RepID=UPI0018CB5EB6|nr:HAMP domain-containing sensor histidine kinase [Aureivirga sp. CE67]
MKKRLQILITVSVLAFLFLSVIQYSLIKNTYDLEKKIFRSEIENIISKIKKTESFESFEENWKMNFSEFAKSYQMKKLTKQQYLDSLFQFFQKENLVFDKMFEKEKSLIDLKYDLDYQVDLEQIIFFSKIKNDTISFEEKYHIGNGFSKENALSVNNSIWKVETSTIDDENKEIELSYEIQSSDYVKINNDYWIVFQRMSYTFIFSVLLFVLICALFFYTVKSMIKQKDLLLLKTDFINNIIHEFKTPLATLKIASKSLRNKKITGNEVLMENTLKTIERQNTRLEKLLNQIVEISPNNPVKLELETVEISSFLREIYEDFQISCSQKEIVFLDEISSQKIFCEVSKMHLTIAIQNLLDNAVKYSKENIKIEVKSFVENDFYQIQIKDSGIGISAKKQKEIFKKFYRVSSGNVHNVKGLGLGLFYTKQIIELHHGEISVKSELEKGTLFNIKLPLKNEK